MHLSPLHTRDRARVENLLVATGAFTESEVSVALELFDVAHPGDGASTTADDGPALAVAPDYEFIGAYADDAVLIGYACYGPTPATDGMYDLYWLAVDPAAQGRGAGTALVMGVEHELAARGARRLIAETSSLPRYARTRAFYASRGYVEEARVRDFYAAGDDRIILCTRLDTRDGGARIR